VRPEFIERLTRQYLPEHPGYYGEMVWILMALELWMSARTLPEKP
jgi:asparagine synthase (glutamine-hydrolysing)